MKKPLWPHLLRVITGCLVGLALALAVLAGLLRSEPPRYSRLLQSEAHAEAAEVLARRALTKTAAWHAAISRPGEWEMAITADEINAWLAVDLPRNHPRWLPPRVSKPRLVLSPRQLSVYARLGLGPFTAVATLDFEVVLRNVNHLAIVLEQARLGAIPLPRTAILRELARHISRLGMVTDLRRLDGRMLLMVYIPSTHDAGATSYWLESLSSGDGELLMAGRTRSAVSSRQPGATPLP